MKYKDLFIIGIIILLCIFTIIQENNRIKIVEEKDQIIESCQQELANNYIQKEYIYINIDDLNYSEANQ